MCISSPPYCALKILKLFTPAHHYNLILGDLLEEYTERAAVNAAKADAWFWHQTQLNILIYTKHTMTSETLIRSLFLSIGLLVFSTLIIIVMWLSSMDHVNGFSPNFWQNLLNGRVHLALLEPAFWSGTGIYWEKSTQYGISHFVMMFFDMPALLCSLCLLYLYFSILRRTSSVFIACNYGLLLLLLPYMFGLTLLNHLTFEAQQVGPVLAFMLLSTCYLVLPISIMFSQKFLKQAKSVWTNEH